MTPLRSYRRLLDLVGPTYVVVAFLARIPLAMSQIGTLLLVAGTTGSYGLGGATAGALAIANAIGSPIAGTLADRFGQRPVAGVQALLGAAGLSAIVLTATSADPAPALLLTVAAATGLALPQVGPLARARWRPVTRGEAHQPQLVSTALSYEGAADEASFVLGPVLVGVAAAIVAPAAALLAAAAILAVFGGAFALHRTAPAGTPREPGVRRDPLPLAAIGVLLLSQFLIGGIFGSVQTGTTVLATNAGAPGATGLVHALLGVGSVVAALTYAYLPARFGMTARLRVAAVALVVLALPLLGVDSLLGVALVSLVLGLAIAPYLITTFTAAEQITPVSRISMVMTVLAGVTGLGYAAGSAVAGRLADLSESGSIALGGHTAAYLITVVMASLAVLVALVGGRPVGRALAAEQAPPAGPDSSSAGTALGALRGVGEAETAETRGATRSPTRV